MGEKEFCYVGTKPCGCAVAFVFDDPNDKRWTSRHVAEFIRFGYTISHVTFEECAKILKPCVHNKGGVAKLEEPRLEL